MKLQIRNYMNSVATYLENMEIIEKSGEILLMKK